MASKKKVIAVTEIHRTIKPGQRGDKSKGISPVKPTVQIIAPKTVFMASTEADRDDGTSEFDRLLAAKAIREPEKDEKVQVDIENVIPEDANSKKTGTKKATNKKSEDKTISDMTGAELDAYLEASDHEAPEGWSGMKVDEKKAWLTSAESGSDLV